jgi:hypothetical protein
VEEETIHAWFRSHGFSNVMTLNASEEEPVAYHVAGTRRGFAPPLHDDQGKRIVQPLTFKPETARPLQGPFRKERGFAWHVPLPDLAHTADGMDAPKRSPLVLLEDGQALPLRHTLHEAIRTTGLGTYSHWGGQLLLSTSDNSDPNSNGRSYSIAFSR